MRQNEGNKHKQWFLSDVLLYHNWSFDQPVKHLSFGHQLLFTVIKCTVVGMSPILFAKTSHVAHNTFWRKVLTRRATAHHVIGICPPSQSAPGEHNQEEKSINLCTQLLNVSNKCVGHV